MYLTKFKFVKDAKHNEKLWAKEFAKAYLCFFKRNNYFRD